jgi:hypothetical protein
MTYQFTIRTTTDFLCDLLPNFSREHGVYHSIGFDEGYTVTFRCPKHRRNRLEGARDELSHLVIEDIH